MTEYKLLSADAVKAFNTIVNQHLGDGWTLHGQPFAHGIHNTPGVLYQAVVRCEPVSFGLAGAIAQQQAQLTEIKKTG